MIPIILSGGSGSRLWPLSRVTYPKQFLPLVGEKSLFQETCTRLPSVGIKDLIIVCNNDHRFLAAHQLIDIGIDAQAIILEPFGRNTAPAIAMAALHIEQSGNDEIMLVLPADHVIKDLKAFHDALNKAREKAKEGKVVTFGIVPESANTGFGYIQAENKNNEGANIVAFKEKPDMETAESYIKSGNYYWNSGMFMFSSNIFLKELEKHASEILNSCRKAYKNSSVDLDFTRIDEASFKACPSDSIDYAIMEKTDLAFVIPLDVGWSDLGIWSSVLDNLEQCEDGNAVKGDVVLHDCKRSFFHSDNRLLTAIGLEDMIVVDTLDALLVAPKERVQDVKILVDKLNSQNRTETILHREVHRPWGKFDSIDNGDGYQVKRITVYPGQKLSVQMHYKRSEHWVVVKGTATVTLDGKTFQRNENESTYIPIESVHALENKTDKNIELIEVQCGSYLGEDDIVRFDDIYDREGTTK